MELIPALDLLGGRAARLERGDYARRVAEVDDPVGLARAWGAAGARRLHLVDLDGARAGRPVNLELAARVATAAREAGVARVEAGGGLRRTEDVAALLTAGVDEAVLGTAAVERPGFLAACAARWTGRILASLDIRGGRPAVHGWLRDGAAEPEALAARLVDEGAARLIVTDTERDGTLAGPNLALLARLRAALPATTLVAAGGVRSAADLHALAEVGVDGAIVGLALLTGDLELSAALEALA